MTAILDAALAYRELGFGVLPTTKNKRPYVKWEGRQKEWREQGQTREEVEHLFSGNDRYGLGLLTSPYSDLVVIDFDGIHSPDLWKRTGIILPMTTVHKTPSGLFHYLFRKPNPCPVEIPRKVRLLAETPSCGWREGCGIDLLVNGYVVVPPTPGYHGDPDHPIEHRATLPVEVLGLLPKPGNSKAGGTARDPEWLDRALEGPIREGQRNDIATRIVGHYAAMGQSVKEVERIIRLWGRHACKPPLVGEELARLKSTIERYVGQRRHEAVGPEAFTQLWVSGKLIEYHGRDLRYCPRMKRWFVWDGKRWREDDKLLAQARAKDTLSLILLEAAEERDANRQKALTDVAVKAQKRDFLEGAVSLARDVDAIIPSDLDQDRWQFNCANGTLDLKAGTLQPHRRDDLITKLSPIPYDPEAECPRWRQFLAEVMQGNAGLIRYLQRLLGSALSGELRDDLFIILWGSGQNGKTTLVETMLHVLGEYGIMAASEVFIQRKYEGGHTADVADLFGARFAVVSETGKGQVLNAARIKAHTGRDTIKARRMYQDWFSFLPTHTVFWQTNHRPEIRDTGHAMWRRVRLIPFAYRVPEEVKDPLLGEKLRAEAEGILAWLVEGCLAWQQEGLPIPAEVEAATKSYRMESDPVGRFLEECCQVGEYVGWTSKGEVFERWKAWSEQEGADLGPLQLSQALKEKGFEERKREGVRGWHGLKIGGTGQTGADET